MENVEIELPKVTAEDLIAEKGRNLERYIYSKYTQKNQAQDQVWTDNFRTKLVAMGVTGIEVKVINGVKAFMNGTPIAEYLKDEQAETIPLLTKLIEIAIRSEWAFMCIQEGKLAIAENREPVYAEFPKVTR